MGITIHWQPGQKRPANRVRHRTDTPDSAAVSFLTASLDTEPCIETGGEEGDGRSVSLGERTATQSQASVATITNRQTTTIAGWEKAQKPGLRPAT